MFYLFICPIRSLHIVIAFFIVEHTYLPSLLPPKTRRLYMMKSLPSTPILFYTPIWSIPSFSFSITINRVILFPSTKASCSSWNSLIFLHSPTHFSVSGMGVSISLKLVVLTVVMQISWNPIFIAVRIYFLMESICIPASCLNNELLFYITGTSWIALLILFLMSSGIMISLIRTIKCEITKTTLKIPQPHLINNTTQGFNKDTKSRIIFNYPTTKQKGILRNKETYTKISYNIHKIYRSGVGSLIYLVKHLRPKLSNAVHELSKCMKKNMCEIMYVIDKKYYWCQVKTDGKLNVSWELCCYSDADYAGDNDTQKSVTGYIIIINRLVVDWHSLSQKTFTWSITESEYS